MSDHRGAAMMLPALPAARELLADRGYDSSHFRAALLERGIVPCIPSTRSRKVEPPYNKIDLPTAPPHREHVRPYQGLAPHRNTLRPLRSHLLLRHLHRSNRHLLAHVVSPEPGLMVALASTVKLHSRPSHPAAPYG